MSEQQHTSFATVAIPVNRVDGPLKMPYSAASQRPVVEGFLQELYTKKADRTPLWRMVQKMDLRIVISL